MSWSVKPGCGSRWSWRRLARELGGVPERAGRPVDGAVRGGLRGRAGALVVAVLVAGAVVAACSGGGTQAGATASAGWTAGPSVQASASGGASASVTPTLMLTPEAQASRDAALATPEPARVEGMDEHSSYGASQTAAYFLSLYPYVYATGDLTTWKDMSQDTCIFCNSVITNVTNLHNDGGWSDNWLQEIATTSTGVDPDDPDRHVITFNVLSAAHTQYYGDPIKSHEAPQTEGTILIQVYWRDGVWIVEEGEVQ